MFRFKYNFKITQKKNLYYFGQRFFVSLTRGKFYNRQLYFTNSGANFAQTPLRFPEKKRGLLLPIDVKALPSVIQEVKCLTKQVLVEFSCFGMSRSVLFFIL